jgi:hypothetical protein
VTDSQLSAWEEVVAAAKRDAANHRMALNIKKLAYYEKSAHRRKLLRCEAILAMDVMYHHFRQLEEDPGVFDAELDDMLS